MTATIHHCEIFAWQKRQLAGEIYITGMAASTKGYILTYMETLGMKPLNNLRGAMKEEPSGGSQPLACRVEGQSNADDSGSFAGSITLYLLIFLLGTYSS